jgi:hypothetical protein
VKVVKLIKETDESLNVPVSVYQLYMPHEGPVLRIGKSHPIPLPDGGGSGLGSLSLALLRLADRVFEECFKVISMVQFPSLSMVKGQSPPGDPLFATY